MKKTIKLFALAIIAVIGILSCSKQDMNRPDEIKNVTLDVTLNAGEVYNLDLSPYGVQHATCRVKKEAANVAESKLTTASTNPFTANYQYTGSSEFTIDQVILQVQEDDGTKGGNHNGHSGSGGKTEKCKQPHPSETNITINFTIRATTTSSQQQ